MAERERSALLDAHRAGHAGCPGCIDECAARPGTGSGDMTELDGYLLPLSTTEEVRERRARVAVLPVGSFEQHGPFLPLVTDTVVAVTVARAIGSVCPVLQLPPVTISC